MGFEFTPCVGYKVAHLSVRIRVTRCLTISELLYFGGRGKERKGLYNKRWISVID